MDGQIKKMTPNGGINNSASELLKEINAAAASPNTFLVNIGPTSLSAMIMKFHNKTILRRNIGDNLIEFYLKDIFHNNTALLSNRKTTQIS